MESHVWGPGAGYVEMSLGLHEFRGQGGHRRLVGLLLRSVGEEFLRGLIEQQTIEGR